MAGARHKRCSFQAVPHCMHTLGLANTFLGAAGSFLFRKPAPVEYLRGRLTTLTRVRGEHASSRAALVCFPYPLFPKPFHTLRRVSLGCRYQQVNIIFLCIYWAFNLLSPARIYNNVCCDIIFHYINIITASLI